MINAKIVCVVGVLCEKFLTSVLLELSYWGESRNRVASVYSFCKFQRALLLKNKTSEELTCN